MRFGLGVKVDAQSASLMRVPVLQNDSRLWGDNGVAAAPVNRPFREVIQLGASSK